MTETSRRDKGAAWPICASPIYLEEGFALAGARGQPEGQQSKEMTEKESAAVESQILHRCTAIHSKRRSTKNSCSLVKKRQHTALNCLRSRFVINRSVPKLVAFAISLSTSEYFRKNLYFKYQKYTREWEVGWVVFIVEGKCFIAPSGSYVSMLHKRSAEAVLI